MQRVRLAVFGGRIEHFIAIALLYQPPGALGIAHVLAKFGLNLRRQQLERHRGLRGKVRLVPEHARNDREAGSDDADRLRRNTLADEGTQEYAGVLPALAAVKFQRPRNGLPFVAPDGTNARRLHPPVARVGRICSAERVVAGQQLIGDQAERVHIVRRVRVLPLDHVDGGVRHRQAAQGSGVEGIFQPLDAGDFRCARDAEIQNLAARRSW